MKKLLSIDFKIKISFNFQNMRTTSCILIHVTSNLHVTWLVIDGAKWIATSCQWHRHRHQGNPPSQANINGVWKDLSVLSNQLSVIRREYSTAVQFSSVDYCTIFISEDNCFKLINRAFEFSFIAYVFRTILEVMWGMIYTVKLSPSKKDKYDVTLM